MGVQDRDWYKNRREPKIQNSNWQKEYNRWYGRPNTPIPGQRGMHWTLRLMCWVAAFLAVYICARQLKPAGTTPIAIPPASTPSSIAAHASQQQPAVQSQSKTTPQQRAIYKCDVRGHTIYTEEPCQQTFNAIVGQMTPQSAAPTNVTQPQVEDSAAAARRADEQLARQWDARMAQRDRDIATEQVVMQSQANAINAQCNQLRTQRESIQRMPLPYQQSSPWREQMNDVRIRMNQLHC